MISKIIIIVLVLLVAFLLVVCATYATMIVDIIKATIYAWNSFFGPFHK